MRSQRRSCFCAGIAIWRLRCGGRLPVRGRFRRSELLFRRRHHRSRPTSDTERAGFGLFYWAQKTMGFKRKWAEVEA